MTNTTTTVHTPVITEVCENFVTQDDYYTYDPFEFKTIVTYTCEYMDRVFILKMYLHSTDGGFWDSVQYEMGQWVGKIISSYPCFIDSIPDKTFLTDSLSSEGFITKDGGHCYTLNIDPMFVPYEGGPYVDGQTIYSRDSLKERILPEVIVTPPSIGPRRKNNFPPSV